MHELLCKLPNFVAELAFFMETLSGFGFDLNECLL